ncbi:hypothetical protein Leryth_011800 [Lithospermum erythrorhizon]|nr:hypothetical protein Leryth_011800 [Lithospermum erythrorhizon]
MLQGHQMEHSLIQSLKSLWKQIFTWQPQWQSVNPVLYLQPFLDVIRSDETGALITGVALSSVYKILTLDVLDLNTVNIEDYALELAADLKSDPTSEEVSSFVQQNVKDCYDNQHVCTIVNTCFRIVHQSNMKSELLQRMARFTMNQSLNVVEHPGLGPRGNTIAFDEDVPLFALGLITSAIELGGPAICNHPRLLILIQDELFHNLMQFGLSMSPLILSMPQTTDFYTFFLCDLRPGTKSLWVSYQQQEVASGSSC